MHSTWLKCLCENGHFRSTVVCILVRMVVRLSDISSKTGKKCIFCVFRLFLSLGYITFIYPSIPLEGAINYAQGCTAHGSYDSRKRERKILLNNSTIVLWHRLLCQGRLIYLHSYFVFELEQQGQLVRHLKL